MLSISQRLLRSVCSSSAQRCCDLTNFTKQKFCSSHGLCSFLSRDCVSLAESFSSLKGWSSFLSCRRLSTILTPTSGEAEFPSHLLSNKIVTIPDRNIGLERLQHPPPRHAGDVTRCCESYC